MDHFQIGDTVKWDIFYSQEKIGEKSGIVLAIDPPYVAVRTAATPPYATLQISALQLAPVPSRP
jgi:hypothetical protein